MMLLGFIFIISLPGCLFSPLPNVTCMIINLEYVKCTWNEQGIPDYNYTFYSRFGNQSPYTECPEYLRKGVHTVGCKRPYGKGQKFDIFYSKLSCPDCAANNTSEWKQESDLRDRVRLNPPHNLSLAMQSSSELWLYWNISAMSSCVESEVGYRKSTDQKDGNESWGSWTSLVVQTNSFRLHFPSSSNRYAFRVRTRVQANCRESMWSDWSSPVFWGDIKQKNITDRATANLYMPNVTCMIINLEYVKCTWNEQGIPEFNYTFYSRFGNQSPYTECPEYLREGVHTVGCKRPYGKGQKFDIFYSKLSCPDCAANSTSEQKQESDLRDSVKLDPPHNLSLAMQSSSELWLYWNISAMSSCVESEVGYRKSTDQKDGNESWGSWTSLVVQTNSFRLHFPSSSNRYAFRVRTRVQANCRESMWSDWSSPVFWEGDKAEE